MITARATETTSISIPPAAWRRRAAAIVGRRPRTIAACALVLILILLVSLFGASVILVAVHFDPIPWPI